MALLSCKTYKKYKNIVQRSNNIRRALDSLLSRNGFILISRAKGGINEREAVLCTKLAWKARVSQQWWITADGDQPMRTSPTKIRKSKNTASVPAVRIHPCGRIDKCNTMYSSESQILEEAPSASSPDIKWVSSVPPWPKIKPIRAARADPEYF